MEKSNALDATNSVVNTAHQPRESGFHNGAPTSARSRSMPSPKPTAREVVQQITPDDEFSEALTLRHEDISRSTPYGDNDVTVQVKDPQDVKVMGTPNESKTR